VPGLEDWEYVFTPGHSPGHVVFFRKRDRVLIAGDAVLTTPLWGLLPSLRRVSRPPRLSCWNWRGTMTSIAALAFLKPVVLACGHGIPMAGAEVAGELRALSVRVSGSVTWQPTKGK
jgi:glyoxylase-like metal-dependent hydrolase (beta-lactamase superfamily II)